MDSGHFVVFFKAIVNDQNYKMKSVKLFFLCIYFSGAFAVFAAADETGSSQGFAAKLTQEERNWLQEHPVVRISPDPDFLPVEFINKSGEYTGIAADYLKLMQKLIGIEFEILKFKNWDEVLEKTKNKESDMWGAAAPTPQRLEYMAFTKSYVQMPAVIIVRKSISRNLTLKDLKWKKVGVISDYGIHDYLRNNYPKLILKPVDNITAGLNKVSFGMLDVMVANVALASYYIEKTGLTNLRIAGRSGFNYNWAFATRKDWPEFNSILDKALSQITPEQRKSIYRKWISLDHDIWAQIKNALIGIGVVLLVGGVVAILYWNRSLKTQVRKRTEEINRKNVELQKLDDLKNKFLGMAAHDLRNPLTSVMGFTEMIIEMDLEKEEEKKYLEIISQASREMLNLINDLLDVSEIESGKFKMSLSPANLKEVIENRIKLSGFAAKAKKINIASALEDIPDFKFDKGRIAQVLDNLLGNAIKFSEAGTAIDVSLKGNEDEASFRIKDQGPGIDALEAKKLFGEFERLSNKPTAGEKSTGLGMAIVKKIVDDHKGRIRVESEVGKGTAFIVSLPMNK